MPDKPAGTGSEEQIFEAALRVFARKGKDGARMQEIADEAGINKAMLHYYFRTKDRLYREVFSFVLRRFLRSFASAVQGADTFGEMLQAFIDAYIDFIKENLDVMRLLVNENLAGGRVMGEHIRLLMKSTELTPPRLFANHVAAAIGHGEIRPVDPFQTLLTVISACIFPFVFYPTMRGINPAATEDWDAFVEARKEHLFKEIYYGLRRTDGAP